MLLLKKVKTWYIFKREKILTTKWTGTKNFTFAIILMHVKNKSVLTQHSSATCVIWFRSIYGIYSMKYKKVKSCPTHTLWHTFLLYSTVIIKMRFVKYNYFHVKANFYWPAKHFPLFYYEKYCCLVILTPAIIYPSQLIWRNASIHSGTQSRMREITKRKKITSIYIGKLLESNLSGL